MSDDEVLRESERESERERVHGYVSRERESDTETERVHGSVYPASKAGEDAMWRRRVVEEEDALEPSVGLAFSHDTAALQVKNEIHNKQITSKI